MRFNRHSTKEGDHAFLSPSQHHWTNYTTDRLVDRWITHRAAMQGSAQHEYACQEIRAGRKSEHEGTLGMFINDCIEHEMTSEQVLYFSENCFGTADAISFKRRRLKIFDLKTGVTKTSVKQLEVYAALFCLEYDHDPCDLKMEFRIYQHNGCTIFDGDPEAIWDIMETIQLFDRQINQLKMEEAT